MASRIKTEMPATADINAILINARALRAEAMAEMMRGLGRAVRRLWMRRPSQVQPAH